MLQCYSCYIAATTKSHNSSLALFPFGKAFYTGLALKVFKLTQNMVLHTLYSEVPYIACPLQLEKHSVGSVIGDILKYLNLEFCSGMIS